MLREGESTYTYSGSDNIDEVAWYWGNSCNGLEEGDPNYGTHEVGKKKANALGIYDMSGNVWEWCWDWYGKDYYKNSPANNPRGPASGHIRVIRSEGWYLYGSRCACRSYYAPDDWFNGLGFRVVRSSK